MYNINPHNWQATTLTTFLTFFPGWFVFFFFGDEVKKRMKKMDKYKEFMLNKDSHLSHYKDQGPQAPSNNTIDSRWNDSLWTTHIMSVCSGYLA